jgi:hypothetical protein
MIGRHIGAGKDGLDICQESGFVPGFVKGLEKSGQKAFRLAQKEESTKGAMGSG